MQTRKPPLKLEHNIGDKLAEPEDNEGGKFPSGFIPSGVEGSFGEQPLRRRVFIPLSSDKFVMDILTKLLELLMR